MTTYNEALALLIRNALQEDTGDGDHTTLSCIPPDAKGKAILKIKEDGILAGMGVAAKIFRYVQPDAVF
ncbi:MAG TPA: nicotinate-nucleotide diphosphorylase (carboxylating), partial [Agriterribacter sp.]|nr:nicotinate-nucleotide diphosphorylase (carboxylating) [Agriterribacter sp.]